jgi:histone H3/H4
MSTRKRTYAELTQPPTSHQTPSRPALRPSTPHAIRALQQRSGAKQRSAVRSTRKTVLKTNDLPRPDSARGILKRLAQLTAPLTKRRVVTPVGKENEVPEQDEDGDWGEDAGLAKPGLTLPIEEDYAGVEDEDSELPTAPTPSALPDDDYDHTMTFKSIDFARNENVGPASERIDRRVSRQLFRGDHDEDEDIDVTADITAEIGRRAVSEGPPTERFPRGSFGSIRMSDFGEELEVRRSSDFRKRRTETSGLDDGIGIGSDSDLAREFDAETENLRRLRSSPSQFSEHELSMPVPALGDDEETFRLDGLDAQQGSAPSQSKIQEPAVTQDQGYADLDDEDSCTDAADADNGPEVAQSPLFVPQSPSRTRNQTPLETAATHAPWRARKRLKLTRHGHAIPSLPSSLIRRIATETQTRIGKRKPKLGREHMKALEQATEWFFEQVGEDLKAFSGHAKRKKRVHESDMLMLMRKQRVAPGEGELKAMADEWLTREVARELDLPDKL